MIRFIGNMGQDRQGMTCRYKGLKRQQFLRAAASVIIEDTIIEVPIK